MKNKHQIVLSLFISALTTLLLAQSSRALSSTITSPFDIGSTWYICQGYNGPVTHQGTYALDITSTPGCDTNAPSGQNVRAPLAGTVAWYGAAYGSLCINTQDSRSIALYHVNSSLAYGNTVTQGQVVGSIGAPNTTGNGGIPHLHLQMWANPGCSGPSQIPFDLANRARICGAPDLTALGPDYYNNGNWSGISFTSESCVKVTQGVSGTVYRFWSNRSERHFYTASYAEAQSVADTWPDTWAYEGAVFTADPTCTGPAVHRFWSNRLGGHFYTASESEKNEVLQRYPDTWQYEGQAYCAVDQNHPDAIPMYRFWSNQKQAHFYTADTTERDHVIATWPTIWAYEGPVYFVKGIQPE